MPSIVKVISTALDSVNRRITKVYATNVRDVRTAYEISPFGVDGNPIKDLRAVYSETDKNGDRIILGYVGKNCKAGIGEVRLYSWDGKKEATYIWLKTDHTIEIGGNADFAVRYNELKTAFNSLQSDFNSLVAHYNILTLPVSGAIAGPPSTPPIPTNTADITLAKNPHIKTS